jgi:chemotaxis protein MotB
MFFFPFSEKLKGKSKEEVLYKTIAMEGILNIQKGVNPMVLREILMVFLPLHQRQKDEDGAVGAGASLVFDQPGSAPSPTNSADSTGTQNTQGAFPKREEQAREAKVKEVVVTERQKFEELKEKVQKYVDQKGIQNDVSLKVDDKGLYLSITGTVLFDNGKADLTPAAKRVIHDVFDIFSVIDNPIRVEGHTDNIPIHTYQFPSNWELSSARSLNLLRYLIEEYKMDP